MQRIITNSEKQTFSWGKKIAKTLKGGEVLALIGALGAGKTILIKGIAAGLGIKKIITSPTFVLLKVYPLVQSSKLKVQSIKYFVHLDCYRIKNPQEIIDIGATEYFNRPDTITVIEWADKIKSILPSRQTIKIKIKLKGKNLREITTK